MKDKSVQYPSYSSGNTVLSVIVVNYNGKEYMGPCLESIKESTSGIKCEVIVVDNHSTDGSVDWIKKNHPSIHLIENPENFGFSKANNQGLKASSGSYVLLLNPDTVLGPSTIKELLAEIKNNPDVGGVGPALLNKKKEFQVSFGGKVGFFSEAAKKLFLNHVYRARLKKHQKKRDVLWLSAACFMSSREALEKAGMFDENFFLYFEDIDLCLRIRKKGWKLRYFPKAKVYHSGGESTGKDKLTSRFYYRQSQLYFYRKHNSALSYFLLKAFISIDFVLILFQGFFKKKKALQNRIRFFRLLR